MYRAQVKKVTSAGVYVLCPDVATSTIGPCQAVVANYAVGDMVLCDNVGDDGSPDLIVVGRLTATRTALRADADNYVDFESLSDSKVYLGFKTNGYTRFYLDVGSAAWAIRRYDDSGNFIDTPVYLPRSSGKWVMANGATVGAAGIELGSSGPTITTGTGAPSHSAPNGSIYLRTDGTASTTLYVRAGGSWTALS